MLAKTSARPRGELLFGKYQPTTNSSSELSVVIPALGRHEKHRFVLRAWLTKTNYERIIFLMTNTTQVRSQEISAVGEQIRERYDAFRKRGLKLNLMRGKPSLAQLDLSAELLSLPGPADYLAEGRTDCRNYGGLQGLMEARVLFSAMMGAPPEQLVIGNNSSLALMHDVITDCLLKGTGGASPWSNQEPIKFLCPVPGYDRHFTICQEYGIRMIPVRLNEDGPEMDQVEPMVAADPTIKGMWCVPKYSNPTGTVYSKTVIERLAAMRTAAPDFRLFWDNAYVVHHLTEERIEIANILVACSRNGRPDRPFVFSSTSKITLPGAGLALFASSIGNVKWFLDRMAPRTIGPDKINQLRHVRYLQNEVKLMQLMDGHRAIIAPKFQKVLDVFAAELGGLANVSWTKPRGGYFISLDVPAGCARRVVGLAQDAGVALTPAGATHPYGNDPEDRNIRIAPTFPDLQEIAQAAEGVALCVLLATTEKIAVERD